MFSTTIKVNFVSQEQQDSVYSPIGDLVFNLQQIIVANHGTSD